MAKNLLLEYSEELATKCELLCKSMNGNSNTIFQLRKSSSSVFANITEAQYPQSLADACEIVEERGVPSIEIDRYDISLVGDSLLDKRLFPIQVLHLAIDLARAEPGGEGDDLSIGGISLFHLQGC